MADQTEVEPQKVMDFGEQTMQTLEGTISNGLETPMSKIPVAQLGMCGLAEARTAALYNSAVVGQLGPLVTDLLSTFRALGTAATVIGANYQIADLTQSNTMVDVEATFNPAPQDSIATQAQQQAAAQEQRQQGYADRITANPGQLPPPTDSTPDTAADGGTSSSCPPPTAADDVAQHVERYGNEEDSMNPEPDGPRLLAPGQFGYNGYTGGYTV